MTKKKIAFDSGQDIEDFFQTIFLDGMRQTNVLHYDVHVWSAKNPPVTIPFQAFRTAGGEMTIFYKHGFFFPVFGGNERTGFVSYVGKGTTCGDFVDDLRRLKEGEKTPLFFAAKNAFISGVSRKTLVRLTEQIPYKVDSTTYSSGLSFEMARIVVAELITDGKKRLNPKEFDVLGQMLKEITDAATGGLKISILDTKDVQKDRHRLVALQLRDSKKIFIVGDNGRLNAALYVLGGLPQIEQKNFLKQIERPGRDER